MQARGARSRLLSPERACAAISEIAVLPEETARALESVLRGARMLDINRGGSRASDLLLETFRPTRLIEFDLGLEGLQDRISIPEPNGAFDAVFLFGLLPLFVDPSVNLFDEAIRVLADGGTLVASTPLDTANHRAIPDWALRKAAGTLNLSLELTRGRLELVETHAGISGVARFLMVARKSFTGRASQEL